MRMVNKQQIYHQNKYDNQRAQANSYVRKWQNQCMFSNSDLYQVNHIAQYMANDLQD